MVSATNKNFGFLALITVVTALTWALGLLDIQYTVKQEVAFLDGFPGDTRRWQPAGDWSNVEIGDDAVSVLRHSSERSYAKRTFMLPDSLDRSSEKLRITGSLETLAGLNEPIDERGAAYMVWLQDDTGEVVRYLTVQDLPGDRDTYEAERIVSIPAEVNQFTLVLNSRDADRGFMLTDAAAQIITTTPLYQVGSVLLAIAWLAVLLLCLRWFRQNASRTVFIMSGLLIVGIIAGVLLPESMTIGFIDPVFSSIADWVPALDFQTMKSTYKIGHFVFFFLIALLLAFEAENMSLNRWILLVSLCLLAVASEGMQLHLFNRTTRLSDLYIDGAGILAGWSIGWLVSSRRKSQRHNDQTV